VTEFLYALIVRRPRPLLPREVHIVTTHGAHAAVVGALLGPRGAIERLRQDYRVPAETLRCSLRHVHVLTGARDRPLDDIRSPADSAAAGEGIARLVRSLASDDAVALHCSLAGGRKTMSALLATALQLHGRPQDRLYHVLVSEPFERVSSFFYPPPRPARHRVEGRVLDFHRARVDLVTIPFVALGPVARRFGLDGLAVEALAAELEAAATGRLRPEALEIDLAARRAVVGTSRLPLPPQELALYALYAELRHRCRRPGCQEGGRCPACHPTDDELHDRRGWLAQLYRMAGGRGPVAPLHLAEDSAAALEAFREWAQQVRSRLNRVVRATLGVGPRGEPYGIRSGELDPAARRRGLGLPPALVHVERDPGRGGLEAQG
jgi:CRISPR-associated protein (TIGR02584 family)